MDDRQGACRFAWLLWVAYFAIFAVLFDRSELAGSPSLFAPPDAGTTLVYLLLVYPLLLLVRSLGAVGLLVFAFVVALLFGYGLVIVVMVLGLGGGGAFRDPSLMPGLHLRLQSLSWGIGLDVQTFTLILLLCSLAVFVVPAVLGVRWLGRRYQVRKLSDQALTIAAS